MSAMALSLLIVFLFAVGATPLAAEAEPIYEDL